MIGIIIMKQNIIIFAMKNLPQTNIKFEIIITFILINIEEQLVTNVCNLELRLTTTIPVIFHNLKGYDMHLLLQEVGRFKRELTVIPCNMEKYVIQYWNEEKMLEL